MISLAISKTFSALRVCTWTNQFVTPALITSGISLSASLRTLTQILVAQVCKYYPWRSVTWDCLLKACLMLSVFSSSCKPLHEYNMWNLVSSFKYLNLGKCNRDEPIADLYTNILRPQGEEIICKADKEKFKSYRTNRYWSVEKQWTVNHVLDGYYILIHPSKIKCSSMKEKKTYYISK